jgi:protein-tyrosine phosphatase
VARHWSPDPTFSVLFVCTGNICRSALAERLARAYLDAALGDDAALVRVHSAGVQAVVGSGVHPDSALVLAGLGGDAGGFAARQLVDDLAIDADLILSMTRAHRRAVLKAAPRALSRTFTLREAADLLAILEEGADLHRGAFADRARDLVKQLAAARGRRTGRAAADVPDPIGVPLEVPQQVGDLVTEALVPVLDKLVSAYGGSAGDAPAGSNGPGADAGPDAAPRRLHLAS